MRVRSLVLAVVTGLLAASPAMAAHHLWRFTEAYSNASGTVQYVELFCTAASENALGSWSVVQGANTFNFVTNLPSTATANTTILLATANFSSLAGGVTPDYTIPAHFLNTAGGTLTYASGVDVWTYGALPADGFTALKRDGSTLINNPTNFAGQTGSINAALAPGYERWGLILVVGAMLLIATLVMRRRETSLA